MRLFISTAIVLVAISLGPMAEAESRSSAREARPAPEQTAAASTAKPPAGPEATLALQVALDRAGFSPGEIDGKRGSNTDRALRAFQEANGLTATAEPDNATIERLGVAFANPLSTYAISAEDTAGPFVAAIPEDMVRKADLPMLGYTSIQELLAERFHTSPSLLQQLNPTAQFTQGEVISVPNVEPFFITPPNAAGVASADAARAADTTSAGSGRGAVSRANGTFAGHARDASNPVSAARKDVVVTVTDKTKTLVVTDGSGKAIFHAPVTVGSARDPLPVGEWKVNGVQWNPVFNYNPDLFWDADPAHSKAKLGPGPNNPVGVVWIDLSKEHYGIHGTPEPSRIGHTQSHGCIRLTNWDAMRLAAMVAPGAKVILR